MIGDSKAVALCLNAILQILRFAARNIELEPFRELPPDHQFDGVTNLPEGIQALAERIVHVPVDDSSIK